MRKTGIFTLMAVLILVLCFGCSKEGKDNSAQGGSSADKSGQTEEINKTEAKTDDTAAAGTDAQKNTEDKDINESEQTAGTDRDNTSDITVPEDGSRPIESTLSVDAESPDKISVKDSVYTITGEGEFIFSGYSDEARIVVDAKKAEVTITLNGVDITSSRDSVIYVEDAEEVTIKAQNGTVNKLTDARPEKSNDDDEAGSACIYSKDDLKLQGKGTLIVIGNYNNGIHSKNDIKIKNLKLEVIAVNNAVKGNDSITVESGEIKLIAKDGDGLKTKNSDVSSKGKQHGIIRIDGGVLNIYADSDCIQAAYDLIVAPEAEVNEFDYKD